jgi:hypothetical protein
VHCKNERLKKQKNHQQQQKKNSKPPPAKKQESSCKHTLTSDLLTNHQALQSKGKKRKKSVTHQTVNTCLLRLPLTSPSRHSQEKKKHTDAEIEIQAGFKSATEREKSRNRSIKEQCC